MAPPGTRRAARRAGRPDHRPPARPPPPAVGDLRHRGPARRPLRHPDQGPPRHGRRSVGRRAAHDDARRRPGRRSDRAARRGVAARADAERRRGAARGRRRASSASRPAASCSARARSASSARPPATRSWWRRPTRSASSLRGPLGTVLNIGRKREPERRRGRAAARARPPARRSTPRITPHRRFAFRSASLSDIKAIKNALGATVNDVVMAVCAGGLRTWLEAHDALPDQPLVAMIPVSVRTGEEEERWTNRVSAIFASLPTDEPDPLRAGRSGSTRRWSTPRSCSTRCPADVAHRLRPVPAAGRVRPGHAHRHPPDRPVPARRSTW